MKHPAAAPAVLALTLVALCAAPASAQQKACANANGLGVARTVEIDTTGGPGFGLEQYKAHDFLQPKEIVLTFDDGPQKIHTDNVLAALRDHCTKATFFSIGKMALGYPEIIRRVAAEGHTVGTHTWSHPNLRRKKSAEEAIAEIERGNSAVARAVGGPVAPFFRFPQLADSPETIKHLQSRNIAMFSMDVDSFDFKFRSPDQTVKSVIDKLEKKGKGIVLMHDIQPVTGKAIASLLSELKSRGYRVVHLKARDTLKTLPEFDKAIETDVKGLPVAGTERPTSSVVRTIDDGAQKSNLGGPAASPAKAADVAEQRPAAAANTMTIVGPTPQPAETQAAPATRWFWQR
ncbi:MAG TPA: polysaccharide deacetylase family protein [Hyphomicrobiaceae bacterium]|nr:polysaccharide deacetylase family protein [Hyphomicrobiaceae bacterium]